MLWSRYWTGVLEKAMRDKVLLSVNRDGIYTYMQQDICAIEVYLQSVPTAKYG